MSGANPTTPLLLATPESVSRAGGLHHNYLTHWFLVYCALYLLAGMPSTCISS